jgi:hypothetical protein
MIRARSLVDQVIIVDGLPGTGKSMFSSSIVPSLERVEIMSFCENIEAICDLYDLNEIGLDTASALVSMFADLKLYNSMMGRHTNTRPTDLTSIFNYHNPKKYLNRMSLEGDAKVLEKIDIERPILLLHTHHKLGVSEPLFKAFSEKLYFLEVVRHPAYVIKQIHTSSIIDLIGNPRSWTVEYEYKGNSLPYYFKGDEDLILSASDAGKAIYFINKYTNQSNYMKSRLLQKDSHNVFVIPFEQFVLKPDYILTELCNFLDLKQTKYTDQALYDQRVPRDKTTDSVKKTLYQDVYKACGGYTVDNPELSELQELDINKAWVKEHSTKDEFDLFTKLCTDYEREYWSP